MELRRDGIGHVARLVIPGALAIFALGLALPGGVVYLSVVHGWSGNPRGFHGIEGAVDWIFGVCAAIAIAAGSILAGVALRLLPRRPAPVASLVLATLSTGFIIATYLVFSDTGTNPNSVEVILLRVICLAMLVVVSLPPFLHWAMAKPATVPTNLETRP